MPLITYLQVPINRLMISFQEYVIGKMRWSKHLSWLFHFSTHLYTHTHMPTVSSSRMCQPACLSICLSYWILKLFVVALYHIKVHVDAQQKHTHNKLITNECDPHIVTKQIFKIRSMKMGQYFKSRKWTTSCSIIKHKSSGIDTHQHYWRIEYS